MNEPVQQASVPRPHWSAEVFTWMGAAGMALVLLAVITGGIPGGTSQPRFVLMNDLGWILFIVGSIGRLRDRTFGARKASHRMLTWLQVAVGAAYLCFRLFALLRG